MLNTAKLIDCTIAELNKVQTSLCKLGGVYQNRYNFDVLNQLIETLRIMQHNKTSMFLYYFAIQSCYREDAMVIHASPLL